MALKQGRFCRMMSGNIDIEEVMRMGPFYDIYCLVENDFIVDTDDNAHKLLDATPYLHAVQR